MKKIVNVILLLACTWFVVSVVKPYWDRYWFEKDLEAAAIFGTKNTVVATKGFLDRQMKETQRDFEGKDFVIEKDENNTVLVSITYEDRVSIFGLTLKELEFSAMGTAREVKAYF